MVGQHSDRITAQLPVRACGEKERNQADCLLLAVKSEGLLCNAGRINKERKIVQQDTFRTVPAGLRRIHMREYYSKSKLKI